MDMWSVVYGDKRAPKKVNAGSNLAHSSDKWLQRGTTPTYSGSLEITVYTATLHEQEGFLRYQSGQPCELSGSMEDCIVMPFLVDWILRGAPNILKMGKGGVNVDNERYRCATLASR